MGEGIARALANEGVHVLITGRNETQLNKIVHDIRNLGGNADFVLADLETPSAVKTIELAIKEKIECGYFCRKYWRSATWKYFCCRNKLTFKSARNNASSYH